MIGFYFFSFPPPLLLTQNPKSEKIYVFSQKYISCILLTYSKGKASGIHHTSIKPLSNTKGLLYYFLPAVNQCSKKKKNENTEKWMLFPSSTCPVIAPLQRDEVYQVALRRGHVVRKEVDQCVKQLSSLRVRVVNVGKSKSGEIRARLK